MGKDSLTDDASAFNRSSNSEDSSNSGLPSWQQYLASLDSELNNYLKRLYALILTAYHCDFSKHTKPDLHHYFVVLEEQSFGAYRTFHEIVEQRKVDRQMQEKSEE